MLQKFPSVHKNTQQCPCHSHLATYSGGQEVDAEMALCRMIHIEILITVQMFHVVKPELLVSRVSGALPPHKGNR